MGPELGFSESDVLARFLRAARANVLLLVNVVTGITRLISCWWLVGLVLLTNALLVCEE